MLPVVFFSHSSADNARAKLLVTALEATGKLKTTFDVRDLKQGEEYAPQLHKWLACCQGAVLLLTENVMKTAPWVLQEATILRGRAMQEGSSFRLFVVIDQAVLDNKVWTQWFAPLKLDELQRVKIVDPAEPAERVVKAVLSGLEGLEVYGTDYFSRLTLRIKDRLKDILKMDAAVQALSDGLDLPDAEWQRIVQPEHALHALFAKRLCQGDFGNFPGIDGLFNALQGLCDKPLRNALLGVLRSYWIPLANASRLADVVARLAPYDATGAYPPNIVLLQTVVPQSREVVDMYRDRQFFPYNRTGELLSVPAGSESSPKLLGQVRVLLQGFVSSVMPDISDAMVVEELRVGLAEQQYVFVHIAAPATLKHVLLAARTFWPCVFILSADAARCAELGPRLDTPVLALPPSAGEEVRHLNAIGKAKRYNETLP